MQSSPSRFIAELPRENLNDDSPISEKQTSDFPGEFQEGTSQTQAKGLKGKRVHHEIWGQGRVVEAEGDGDDVKLSIVFSGGVKKKVMAGFVEFI
jgi:DNA helicase-2/ATP-dependent DNA helicase PcrA